jgi:hypothetical protein
MNEQGNSNMGVSQGVCPECGFSHPPVQGGCPMKTQTAPSGEVIDYNILFAPLKDILYAQIKMKDIKDTKKFFKWMTVTCTKLAEGYTEI